MVRRARGFGICVVKKIAHQDFSGIETAPKHVISAPNFVEKRAEREIHPAGQLTSLLNVFVTEVSRVPGTNSKDIDVGCLKGIGPVLDRKDRHVVMVEMVVKVK